MAKSALKVRCLNGNADWSFPFEVDQAKIATLAPLTKGVVFARSVTTETKYTDTITEPEGDLVTGVKQAKATCIFKHTPTTGDPRLHRISLPAPEIGDTGIYATPTDKGATIPAKKEGTSPGKDGGELATLYKAAMNLEGTFEFMSGKVILGSTKQ